MYQQRGGCHFPEYPKVTKVVAIFKSDYKNLPNNCRPVSIVSTFSKVF